MSKNLLKNNNKLRLFRIQKSLLNAIIYNAINFIIGNAFKNLQRHNLLIRMTLQNLYALFIHVVYAKKRII